MNFFYFHVCLTLLVFAATLTSSADPDPLEDFCVAVPDLKNGVFVNGKFCKNPNYTTPDDFLFSGLNRPGNTTNYFGSNVTQVFVNQLPGLNTVGVSMVRVDYAPNGGLTPPHSHPRAAEIFLVLKGALRVGFVTSNPYNVLFTKDLKEGDVFVFPRGLIHFQQNLGKCPAVAIAALNSQNPGAITIANAVFGSNPRIPVDILARAFQVGKDVVKYLEAQFWQSNNHYPIFNTMQHIEIGVA